MTLAPVSSVSVLAPVGGGSNVGEIVVLADGGYMVVWTHLVTSLLPIAGVTDEQFTAVLGRVFNADGTPRGEVFQVNESTAASGQGNADITLLHNGDVVVVWMDGPNLTDFDVAAMGRVLHADGTPVSGEFELATVSENDQRIPQVAPTSGSGFVAVWSDGRSPYSNTSERWFGQQFDASGNRMGDEFYISADNTAEDSELVPLGNDTFHLSGSNGWTFNLDTVIGLSGTPVPTELGGGGNAGNGRTGGFEDDAFGIGDGTTVFVAPYDSTRVIYHPYSAVEVNNSQGLIGHADPLRPATATGLAQSEDMIEYYNLLGQTPEELGFYPDAVHGPSAAVTRLANGNVVVVWTAVSGGTVDAPVFSVYAQVLSVEGVHLSDVQVIADSNVVGTDIYPPFVAGNADGTVFIGWTGTTDRNGAGTNEIMGGVFDIPLYERGVETAASEEILGTAASDLFEVSGGVDTIYGFDGDDVFVLTGTDAVSDSQWFGMAGNDTFVVTTLDAFVYFEGGSGRDTVDFSALNRGLTTGDSGYYSYVAEYMIGTMFDDHIVANWDYHAEAGNDLVELYSLYSVRELDGGAGTDSILLHRPVADFDLSYSGGVYYLSTVDEPELVVEIRGFEEIQFSDHTVALEFASASRPSGRYGTVTIPDGNPTDGPDMLVGTSGADDIDLLGGNDTYDGMGGNDRILGGAGNDSLMGGAGNDTLDGGAGADHIDGGAGRDVVSYTSATRSVRVDLQNTQFMYGDAVGDTFANVEVFQTGNTVDQLRGDANGNVFYTGGLSDRLYGRAGDDVLFGQTGADAFYGGLGADTMTGGADEDRRDRYIYFNIAESGVGDGNRDVITDFVSGEDRIEIRRFDADTTQGNKQYFDFVGDAGLSGAAGELAYVHEGGNTIVQADVDGDGLADFEIELTGVMELVVDDFLI